MTKNKKKNAIIYILILLVLIAFGLFLKYKQTFVPTTPSDTLTENQTQSPASQTSITIQTEKIKEENFSGTKPVISGDSKLALTAQAYIDGSVDEFRKQANIDVPDMRDKFGADAPMANYTIDIETKEVKGASTDSLVVSEYVYTGGANGNSLYKVFTASKNTGDILKLSDVVKNDKQSAFTAFVKKQLLASQSLGVFPEEVNGLTFGSFTNWSFDDKNLYIYFSKYEIAPGASGPIAFPLALTKIKDFLNSNY